MRIKLDLLNVSSKPLLRVDTGNLSETCGMSNAENKCLSVGYQLMEIINQKIKDARFLKLIRLFLKAGYMEDWKYHETYSGCPQGVLCLSNHKDPYDGIDIMPRYYQQQGYTAGTGIF